MLAAATVMDAAKILPSLLRDSDSELGAALCIVNRLANEHGKYTVPEAQCVLRCVSCLPKRDAARTFVKLFLTDNCGATARFSTQIYCMLCAISFVHICR